MHDLAPAIVSLALVGAFVIPIVIKLVFRHQVQMAELAARGNSTPELVSEIQDLKKQVSDLRELVMDIALRPSQQTAIQQRVNQDN